MLSIPALSVLLYFAVIFLFIFFSDTKTTTSNEWVVLSKSHRLYFLTHHILRGRPIVRCMQSDIRIGARQLFTYREEDMCEEDMWWSVAVAMMMNTNDWIVIVCVCVDCYRCYSQYCSVNLFFDYHILDSNNVYNYIWIAFKEYFEPHIRCSLIYLVCV